MGGQAAATRGDEIWDAADSCMRWQRMVEEMAAQVCEFAPHSGEFAPHSDEFAQHRPTQR
eukprot:1178904-Prorocentrum_minimum.AAC.2